MPIPAPRRLQVVEIGDGFIEWRPYGLADGPGWHPISPTPLPEEFVLRELRDFVAQFPNGWSDLDEASTSALLDFCRRWGAVPRLHPAVTRSLGSLQTTEGYALRAESGAQRRAVNHLADVFEWLLDLHRCVEFLVAADQDDYPPGIWCQVEAYREGTLSRSELDVAAAAAAERFFLRLNWGLAEYRGGVELPKLTFLLADSTGDEADPTVPPTDGPSEPDEIPVMGALDLDLHAAGCLMLHNILLSDLPLKICKNETCRRPFFRARSNNPQRQGRSTKVEYCQPSCQNAAAQRRYRQQKKKKKSASTT